MSIITKEKLVGVWTLEKFIVHRESGEKFIWPGKQNGTLIYTDNGYVSVAQNRDPLPNPTETDKNRVSNFYTARYELDRDNSRVFHTILQSSVPSIIGDRVERQIILHHNDTLELTGIGLKERVTLMWKKITTPNE